MKGNADKTNNDTLHFVKNNANRIIQAAAKINLLAFSRYINPQLDIQPFHKLYYTILDKFAHGEIKKLMVTVPPQHGKQISDGQMVATPSGMKRHGNLKVGDYVFGRDGRPKKVLWVSEKTKSEYVVTFSDGQKIECHGNHEWLVYDRNNRKWKRLETRFIFAENKLYKGNGKRGSRYRYQVDANVCVYFDKKEVEIDPYILGAWLGDGSASKGCIYIGCNDTEIIDSHKYVFHETAGTTARVFYSSIFFSLLKKNGYINNKHIQDEYIYNSVDIRKQLIAGLIDTDGYVYQKNGRITISNTNKDIIDKVAFILRSLGESVCITKKAPAISTSGIIGRKNVYQLSFTPTQEYPTKVPRKKVLAKCKKKKRTIVNIAPIEHIAYGNCIQIEGGIYLVGDTFIPTHNSEGSSRNLPSFMLGLNPDLKIAIGSYSTSFARDFNRDVQKIIDTEKYRQIFPDTYLPRMKKSSSVNTYQRSADVIECVGHKGSLRVVGRGGPLTGKRVDVAILDDVYKDPLEANSPIIRERAWDWYKGVVKARLHNNSQELIVFTRWHKEDIVGKLEEIEQVVDITCDEDLNNVPEDAWVRINFEAIKTTPKSQYDNREFGEALWPAMHSLKKLLEKRKLDKVQFDCLYQGHPGSNAGLLYSAFKIYTDIKQYGTLIRKGNYTDCADEGTDFLCSGCYDVVRSNTAKNENGDSVIFILMTDIIMTDDPIERTTESVPMMLNRNATHYANIESNNGGRAFAKIIEPKTITKINSFTQSANKESRIITNAGLVTYHIIMPFDWETRWPVFYKHVTNFLRNFRANEHDDAPDMLTGIIEKEILSNVRGPVRRN